MSIFRTFSLLSMLVCLAAPAHAADSAALKPARAAALVTLGTASHKDMPVMLNAVGSVEASASVVVKSRVSGELMEVHFKDGDIVKEGDLLFVIDKLPNEIAVREVRAKLEADKASLAKAESDMGRSQTLAKGGFTSAEAFQQAQTNTAMLRAAVKGDEAALERAQLNLSYCEIRAPMTGRAGAALVDRGNLVQAQSEALVRIDAIQPISVNFSVPERYLRDVLSLSAQGILTVLAQVPNQDPVEGVMTFVGNANSNTGTVPLKASFENTDIRLWPGQYVNVQLQLSVLKNAVVVPSRAVIIGPEGTFVYVVGDAMVAEYRLVKISVEGDGLTVITEGLKGGEKVVLEGHVRLAADIPVRLAESTAAPEKAAPAAASTTAPAPSEATSAEPANTESTSTEPASQAGANS